MLEEPERRRIARANQLLPVRPGRVSNQGLTLSPKPKPSLPSTAEEKRQRTEEHKDMAGVPSFGSCRWLSCPHDDATSGLFRSIHVQFSV